MLQNAQPDGDEMMIDGERFADAQSGLPALRHPNDSDRSTYCLAYQEMLLFDRYALQIPRKWQLETIDVYDLETGVRRRAASDQKLSLPTSESRCPRILRVGTFKLKQLLSHHD